MSKNTFVTGVSLTNTMIVTTLVILPMNFHKTGIIENSIATIIMGVILTATANILIKRMLPSEKQFAQAVKRQLGQKFAFLLALTASAALFLAASTIYLLGSDILYDTCCFFFSDLKNFRLYEFRLITFILFLPLAQLNTLKFVLKFTIPGIIMQCLTVVILIYSFQQNISNIDQKAFQLRQITFDHVLFWLSINSYSFICHPSIPSILQQHKDQSKNRLAIVVGFSLSTFIYLVAGILGSLAIYGHHPEKQTNIISYFEGKWQQPALGLSFIFYFLIVFPILCFISRMQILQVLPEESKEPSNKKKTLLRLKVLFTALFIAVNFLFVFFQVEPVQIISFIAAVACWYICYFLPIIMAIGLLKKSKLCDKSSLLSGDNLEEQTISGVQISFEEQKQNSLIKIISLWVLLIFGTALMIGQIVTIF